MNKEEMKALADTLFSLQSQENNGRGITAIRGSVNSLTFGDLEGAKAYIQTDWDKIRNYPHIARYIKAELFPNVKHMGFLDEKGNWVD